MDDNIDMDTDSAEVEDSESSGEPHFDESDFHPNPLNMKKRYLKKDAIPSKNIPLTSVKKLPTKRKVRNYAEILNVTPRETSEREVHEDEKHPMIELNYSVVVQNLKNALFSCIVDALSANSETRRIAEEKISAMELLEEFAFYLCEIALNKEFSFAVRQMSTVLLKQYIDAHWNTEEDHPLRFNFTLRERIKKQLMSGLKENNTKIRNAFAYCVSNIGSMEYPDIWPNFFENLHIMSVSEPENINAIIRVYEDFIRDVDIQKQDQIAEPLLKELCFVLHEVDKYDVVARTSIVYALCLYLNRCSIQHDQIKLALNSRLMPLCAFLVDLLQAEDSCNNDYGLKTNIIRFFTLLIQKDAKTFGPVVVMIMPTIWGMVKHYGDIYAKSIIDSTITFLESEDDDGKLVGYSPLVLSLFDLIHTLIDSEALNNMIIDVLTDIFYYVVIFMHITKKLESTWMSEPLTIEDDTKDDTNENFDTTIRVTACDVLKIICHDFDSEIVLAHFTQAINRHTSGLRFVSEEWRIHESIMYAMGCIKDIIIRASFAETLQLPFYELITTWQFTLSDRQYCFLFGRALWFSGRFSPILTQTLFHNYMRSTMICLNEQSLILRIFAVRTIVGHCDSFYMNPNKALISNHFLDIVKYLLDMISDVQRNLEVLILGLYTLNTVLDLDMTFAAQMEPRISTVLINLFLKHHADPGVIDEIVKIVKLYCVHTETTLTVTDKFTPILANVLNTEQKVPYGLHTVAMDLLKTLVKYSKPPLSENLLMLGFPAAMKCIHHTDDQTVMCIGSECLRSYLLIGAEQICNYRDDEGTHGLQYTLSAITQMLDPAQPEDACKRIGRLIITLINKTGPVLGSHMHFLLRTILSKMQRVEKMDVWQSLLLVFVYLFYAETEFVVNFLTSVPGPTGQSALEFVLVEWLKRESFFVGSYDRTVSVVALVKLIEYGVSSQDSRLSSILVADVMISKSQISTRTPAVYSQLPILSKAFKVICSELSYQLVKNTPTQSGVRSTEESEDSDEDSASQASDYRYYDNDPDQLDALYAQDPVFNINILNDLTEFIRRFKTVPRFPWYVNLLDDKIKNSLASLILS